MKKEKCAIDSTRDLIPDAGLGAFIEGYASDRDPFVFKFLWWLLFPIAGQIIVVMYVLMWLLGKYLKNKNNVYLYEEGFLWEIHPVLFGKDEQILVRYAECGGIRSFMTRQYQSTYGIKTYQGTHVLFEVCDTNYVPMISQKIVYRNEQEKPDGYNSLGYAIHAIINQWNNIALNRMNEQLKKNGNCEFYSIEGKNIVKTLVGSDMIESGGKRMNSPFRYSFDQGYLFIWSNEEGKSKKPELTINVNNMYNKDLFFMAINQLIGIK